MTKHTNTKTYKRKISKKKKSRRNRMKGGGCGCNSTIMTGGLANSPYYYELNTHNIDPTAPSFIVDSRLLPNPTVTKGGKKRKQSKKIIKIKGGTTDLTKTFSTIATPFFPASNFMNPVVSNGTTAGAITSNVILTGNANLTNPSPMVNNIQSNDKHLV
jgi:hypothetical protein